MSNPPLQPVDQNQSDTPGNNSSDPPVPAWQQAVFEANEARRKAERELEEVRTNPPVTRPPEVPLEAGDAFNHPEKLVSRITGDLASQTKDINEYIREQRRKDGYIQLKARFMSGLNADGRAQFARVEPALDTAYYSDPNLQPTPQAFEDTLTRVVGRLTLSGAFNPAPNNPPTPNNPNPPTPVIPPSVRPSNAPIVKPTPTFDESQFTENERRLARESNMTLEEYTIMRDTPEKDAEKAWRGILAKRKAGGQQ